MTFFRAVVLDIDGPIIPGTMLLADPYAQFKRIVPPTTIAVVKELCRAAGAVIVVNSTQNEDRTGVPDIIDALVAQGLERGHFHPTDPKTEMPLKTRPEALKAWLAQHPEIHEWVALDDQAFIDDRRLIKVDPDVGLSLADLNRALAVFGIPRSLIMV